MKNIIKYFIFVFLLGSIFCSNKFLVRVKAENFYEAEYIDNIWITKERNGTHLYQKARFFRNSVSGKEVYCLDPFVYFNESSNYNPGFSYNSLDSETVKKIKYAAYYGYGYEGHTDPKWYAITQVLIWRYAISNGNFYFTDGLDGKMINSYDNEINEIDRLVKNHFLTPDFGTSYVKTKVGSTITISDNNNVLNYFKVKNNSGLNVSKEDNNLIIKSNKIGNYTIEFEKFSNKLGSGPMFYTSNNSQSLIQRGNIEVVDSKLNIIVEGGYININKYDEDNNSCIAQGEASLDGAIYEIYNENKVLVDTLTINNCTAKSKGLAFGNYIIKEKSPGIGYHKDTVEYRVTINKKNTNVERNLTNKVIKSHIEITKLYGSNYEKDYKVERNIEFGLYDKSGNLINTFITNKSGFISFDLPYGSYTLKQINSTFNYEKVDDINFVINENSDKTITYVLKNNLMSSKLKLVKKDKDTNKEIIGYNAKFKIKNLSTLEYLYHIVDGEKSYIFEINKDGFFLTDIALEFGKYSIEEIVPPAGYKKLSKSITFEINENSNFYYDNDKTKIYEMIVYNEKKDLVINVPDTNSNYSYNVFNLFIKAFYEDKKKIYNC